MRSLLAVISTGKMATDGLAALGDEAVDPVIEKSTDLESHSGSAAAVIVLSRMLELGTIRESTSKAKIKQKLVIAIRAENWGLRMAAVKGLAKFNDPEAISLIEEVANNDPREVPNGDGRSNGFPVREAAQKALKSMKSAPPNK